MDQIGRPRRKTSYRKIGLDMKWNLDVKLESQQEAKELELRLKFDARQRNGRLENAG